MVMDNCPVPAPKLLKAKSLVETCASCGAWSERYPAFMGEVEFWECEKCGNTSIRIREGRPYAPKSRRWTWVVEEFGECYVNMTQPEDWETVETDPPLASLEWAAIEEWFRASGIYRVFMRLPEIEVIETEPGHFRVTVGDYPEDVKRGVDE